MTLISATHADRAAVETRDQFIAAALTGLCSGLFPLQQTVGADEYERIAEQAIRLADATMRLRADPSFLEKRP